MTLALISVLNLAALVATGHATLTSEEATHQHTMAIGSQASLATVSEHSSGNDRMMRVDAQPQPPAAVQILLEGCSSHTSILAKVTVALTSRVGHPQACLTTSAAVTMATSAPGNTPNQTTLSKR